jgi:hypothetical protein
MGRLADPLGGNRAEIAKALGIKPDKLKTGKQLHIVHEK